MPVKISPNAPCPCLRGTKYKKCCGMWHRGRPAPSPTALMRSRFSAYALGLVDYILQTTHADGAPGSREDVLSFCENTEFAGLEILDRSEDGDRGEVTFRATLRQGGRDASFGERSLFFKVDGRWQYHSGERL